MGKLANPLANQEPGNSTSEVVDLPQRTGAPKGRRRPEGSGRKKGTPNRITREVREIAQKYTARAVRQAWKLAKEAKSQDTQLKALELILAYGHGKPTQMIAGDPEGEPIEAEVLDPRELARQVAFILYRGDPKRIIDRRKE